VFKNVNENNTIDLSEFWTYIEKKVKEPKLFEIIKTSKERRSYFFARSYFILHIIKIIIIIDSMVAKVNSGISFKYFSEAKN